MWIRQEKKGEVEKKILMIPGFEWVFFFFVAGDMWLIRREGSYMPGIDEQVMEVVSGMVS